MAQIKKDLINEGILQETDVAHALAETQPEAEMTGYHSEPSEFILYIFSRDISQQLRFISLC